MSRDQSFPVSIEAQLLGGNGKDERSTGNVCTPGTHIVMEDKLVTRHCIPSSSKTYHGDQWVTMEVEVHGNSTIKHIVNGQVVFEYEKPQLDEKDPDAQKLIVDGRKMLHEGYIALQAESHPVEFRKVEILPLAAGEHGPKPTPPIAKKVPKRLEKHGHVRIDDYYWLKERENPKVVEYLQEENQYTDAVMAHTEGIQQTLFEEFRGRIKQTDMSVPYKRDDYYYYTREEDGKEYPIHCRKKETLESEEQIMLNVNELAEGHEFISVRRGAVSSDQDLLAYAVDTVGRRIYTLRFKDLATGELLEDEIPQVTGNVAWANDNKTVFYTKQDPVTLRSYRVYRHVLGTDPADDKLVFEETDDTFRCYVYKAKSKKYVMIRSAHTLSTEHRYVDADDPGGEFKVFLPRKKEHEYWLDHYKDHFYVVTNDQAKNFRLMMTPVDQTGQEHWKELIPHRKDVLLQGIEIFRDHLVVIERQNGLLQLRVKPWNRQDEHYLDFGEPTYLAYPIDNYGFDTSVLRYIYSSMTTPDSVYDYDMGTRQKTLLKQKEVLGGFDSANYKSERLYASAKDDVKIPISLVYRKGFKKDGTNPLLLYGYGSYGASIDASFGTFRVSLLDRGFVCAVAHIRGGQELGRSWYEDGKLLKKKNTFTDFIACAEHLVAEKYTCPDRLFIEGGSAGGLLIGAVVNMRPDLFRGAIAAVPWVDVITTMLDESIPLTTNEYEEWGNPNQKDYYDYMLSYSPYDNIQKKDYPNMLITTSLQDSQVQYWEPAKWVAKLRALKTDNDRLLLRTYMEAGHGGVSGRYKRYYERAFEFAFLIDLAGKG
jgi:oligopeptidase B